MRAFKREKHTIDFDAMYAGWGLAGCSDAVAARNAGALKMAPATDAQRQFGQEALSKLNIQLWPFSLAYSAIVAYYQGPLHAEMPAILLRYTKSGIPELDGEHISAIVNLQNGKLLGLTNMLKKCDGDTFVSHATALHCATEFLKVVAPEWLMIDHNPLLLMPDDVSLGEGIHVSPPQECDEEAIGFSLGAVSVCWIDDHAEKLTDEDGRLVETHGMKVKMRFNDDSARYVWVIVDKHSDVLTFESHIFWNFAAFTRETQMWLHDGWLKTHQLGFANKN